MVMVVVVEGQMLVLVARGERGCVVMGKLFYHQHQSWGPTRAQNTSRELVFTDRDDQRPQLSLLPTDTPPMGPPTHHGRRGIKKKLPKGR